MISRKLVLALSAVVLVTGCRSTSNRVSYCAQPTVACAAPCPTPCAAPAPCATPACPTAAVVPPPPPGFVR
jgi:hypothetical protein